MHIFHKLSLNCIGYETVAVGDMEELASEEEYSETENLDEETKESIRAQAAAAAADAVAEDVPADSPERYNMEATFVTLNVFSLFNFN